MNFVYSFHLVRRDPLMFIGLLGIFLLILMALLAPLIAPYPEDVIQAHTEEISQPPSLRHFFGTDDLGRDIFSRVIYGSRISLLVGGLTTGLALLIGVPLGVIAGSSGAVVDETIMRVTDIFLSFPHLLLAMAISALLGPNLRNVMIAIAVTWWPWYTRLARSEAISVREREFVEASRATGSSGVRILVKHILPNCLTPVIVQASLDIGAAILTTASLSFLGLGAQPPTPEWGLMITIGRRSFLSSWWPVVFPGIAIFVTVLFFNLVGDGLREILDPKTRKPGRKG